MNTLEISCGISAWLLAALGALRAFVDAFSQINPHGTSPMSPSQPMPFHLFYFPVPAVVLMAFVLYSTWKRGVAGKGLLMISLPFILCLILIVHAVLACSSTG
jgi:hypothetical protein